MFRKVDDFLKTWTYETEATLKILRALTEASLSQPVAPGGRTLGFLAWHCVLTLPEMMKHAGIPVTGPAHDAPQPPLAQMIREYEASARVIAEELPKVWTDAMLADMIPMYGEQWPRGAVLSALILHQTHHRAQMTVLMRQAGLRVPGLYGPAREEWAAMNLPPQP
jgi:uncharacterized damage-inducible protein DinB